MMKDENNVTIIDNYMSALYQCPLFIQQPTLIPGSRVLAEVITVQPQEYTTTIYPEANKYI